MKFAFASRNLTRKTGKACPDRIDPKERDNQWEEIEEQPRSDFVCELESRRCEHESCRRQTRRALPYCWQHTLIVSHLLVRRSDIPGAGFGLFACNPASEKGDVVFRKGEKVALYARKGGKKDIGEFLSNVKLADRYGECLTAPYGVDRFPKSGVDTACQRSIGSYANHSKRPNAIIDWVGARKTELWLFATKDIRQGDEIVWDYGAAYRFDYPDFFELSVKHVRRPVTNARCRSKRRASPKK